MSHKPSEEIKDIYHTRKKKRIRKQKRLNYYNKSVHNLQYHILLILQSVLNSVCNPNPFIKF